jgi:hypothetical protein
VIDGGKSLSNVAFYTLVKAELLEVHTPAAPSDGCMSLHLRHDGEEKVYLKSLAGIEVSRNELELVILVIYTLNYPTLDFFESWNNFVL